MRNTKRFTCENLSSESLGFYWTSGADDKGLSRCAVKTDVFYFLVMTPEVVFLLYVCPGLFYHSACVWVRLEDVVCFTFLLVPHCQHSENKSTEGCSEEAPPVISYSEKRGRNFNTEQHPCTKHTHTHTLNQLVCTAWWNNTNPCLTAMNFSFSQCCLRRCNTTPCCYDVALPKRPHTHNIPQDCQLDCCSHLLWHRFNEFMQMLQQSLLSWVTSGFCDDSY